MDWKRVRNQIKRGFRAVRTGEIWRLSRHWWIQTETPITVDECALPQQVTADTDSADVLRIGNEYTMGISDQTDRPSISLAPEKPATAVEFELINNLQKITRVEIRAEFELTDGTTERNSVVFTDGDFNDIHLLPVELSVDNPFIEVTLELHTEFKSSTSSWKDRIDSTLNRLTTPIQAQMDRHPLFGVPRARGQTEGTNPPIFLFSVDTVRHDFLDHLGAVVDALGPTATVPAEPRTQGHWTPASHASTLTGSHPGDHGYVGWMSNEPDNSITDEYQTVAELLTERGYKCSGIVAHTRILPEEGFGRGFHRYALQNMTSWLKRNQDASTVIDTLLRWLDADVKAGSNNLFYFAHIFDPHYPYIPPLSRAFGDIDLSAVEAFRDAPELYEYEESPSQEIPLDPKIIKTLKKYYAESLEYTASQLVRFINELKRKEMFENAFIIIAGDHGEEFYERGLSTHSSLHDANIRSGLIVKPPADSAIKVPEDPDLIDIFPTIAELVDVDIPAQCSGHSWCDSDEWIGEPRITELIRPEKYSLAVEEDGQKAIYTYDSNFPYRPDEAAVDAGPTKSKYYTVSAARDYSTRDLGDVSEDKRRQLMEIARQFLDRSTVHQETDADRPYQLTAETNEQLEKLGYK